MKKILDWKKYEETASNLKNVYYEIQEISRDISSYLEDVEFDEGGMPISPNYATNAKYSEDTLGKNSARLRDDVETDLKNYKAAKDQQQQLSDNMNKISEATYLQNALLEKISVDSMSLVRDTYYMIDYKTPDTIVNFKMPEIVNYKKTPSRTGIESKTN